VKDKYITWGMAVAAFLLTLAIASWWNGWWGLNQPSAQDHGTRDGIIRRSIGPPTATAPLPKTAQPPALSPVVDLPECGSGGREARKKGCSVPSPVVDLPECGNGGREARKKGCKD
jgi:hypothetical protein